MHKLFVFIVLLTSPIFLFGQQTASKIEIVSYSKIYGDIKNNLTRLRNPVFKQDNATLTCDSAVYYNKRNYFEAYQNVHINQLTTDIYSDQLEYDGNKKQAHLTGNVKMIDPTSILTTNILDYNTLSKIGTYTTGGKIVNKEVTLTSKNGYYFSTSNDSYFRYDVVVVTPQVTIKSDTMRYNTQTKWTYFYGPTNIKGKDDNLYTENGAYNTATEDAYFGKKNLYTQGTRSLKGDSLYYYGKVGYGRAVRNIVFSDTKDKMKMFGDLGYYYKADQRTLVTKNAYLGIGTEDSVTVKNKKQPDSLWMGADTLETQMVLQKSLKLIPKISIKADNQIGDDDEDAGGEKEKKITAAELKQMTSPKEENNKRGGKNKNAKNKPKDDKDGITPPDLPKDKNEIKVKVDSEANRLTGLTPDSLKNSNILNDKADSIVKNLPKLNVDSLQKKSGSLVVDVVKKAPKVNLDSVSKGLDKVISKTDKGKLQVTPKIPLKKPDTAVLTPADTLQARVIKAYHGVKVFKTNIQAKTDSLFYTSADSTLRLYNNPIIWSEGSQQIGDTIYVQFKNKKLNNLQAIRNAFLVNTPKDSLRFNQIKGRLMTGFFKDGKFKNLYVDGNAESIYYTQDDSTKVYKEMNQTVSSRIKFIFKDNENDIEDIVYIKSIEGALNPEVKVAKDLTLKGFSWKPSERPKSKKDAVGSAGKAKVKSKIQNGKAPVKPKVIVSAKPVLLLNKTKVPAVADSTQLNKKPLLSKSADTTKAPLKSRSLTTDSIPARKAGALQK
ncbi:OstA-like protein [Pedobacter sp. BMA]|uniref:OstA-like protein n=1 Tax=Pedobacter sp. BMA TaxID=1663685 RepID=UPI0009E4F541|nr:OstA-like protein [Pedobacter sp. BMA]